MKPKKVIVENMLVLHIVYDDNNNNNIIFAKRDIIYVCGN